MSLLIKALDKAENDKGEHSNTKKQAEKSKTKGVAGEDLELSLSPTNSTLAQPSAAGIPSTSAAEQSSSASAPSIVSSTSLVSATSLASSASPKSAANVFSAKSVRVNDQNTSLALIAGAGLVALLAMGLYFYQFVDNTPELVIPPPPPEQLAAVQQPDANIALPEHTTAPLAEAAAPPVFEPEETTQPTAQQEAPELPAKKMANQAAMNVGEAFAMDENEAVADETLVAANANKKARKSKSSQFGDPIASPSASINVSKTKSEAAGVNPVLMSAYEAYNAGDDASAQKLYKQVLQRDVRNADALLGLGAIASRQGRDADANGWFGKVLELDPRNSMAQAALLDSNLQSNQAQGNEANNESRIKNMLAKQPDDANLHAALGNLYAEQNQWPAAQQAYFDAYSLNGSADNAFNLAVSLDQMGKPKLALPYYQRALEQASSTSSIDKAALEARIAAIQ